MQLTPLLTPQRTTVLIAMSYRKVMQLTERSCNTTTNMTTNNNSFHTHFLDSQADPQHPSVADPRVNSSFLSTLCLASLHSETNKTFHFRHFSYNSFCQEEQE